MKRKEVLKLGFGRAERIQWGEIVEYYESVEKSWENKLNRFMRLIRKIKRNWTRFCSRKEYFLPILPGKNTKKTRPFKNGNYFNDFFSYEMLTWTKICA